MSIAIIVIGYNRPKSIQRLLRQLNSCEYLNDNVDLIISVDKGDNENVKEICKSFSWEFGDKILYFHDEKLGLRNNVLFCGNQSSKYDAIIMFEDDIFPSPFFYVFAKKALNYYCDDAQIAGVSLYQHKWNVGCNFEFVPDIDSNSDVYFMQYAQSWGQAWTRKMWNSFYSWYTLNNGDFYDTSLPENVNNWPKSSWLKYFIKYTVTTNKYFVYPKYSLTTNFTDVGTHNAVSSYAYQVPLLSTCPVKFQFETLSDSKVTYDAFFERIEIAKWLGFNSDDICIDLYGLKGNKNKKRYWLTLDKHDYKILSSYAINLKPIELNIKFNNFGNDIFLYDTSIENNNSFSKRDKRRVKIMRILYSTHDLYFEKLTNLYIYKCKEVLSNRIKRILRRR